jgi:hypothetical protein
VVLPAGGVRRTAGHVEDGPLRTQDQSRMRVGLRCRGRTLMATYVGSPSVSPAHAGRQQPAAFKGAFVGSPVHLARYSGLMGSDFGAANCTGSLGSKRPLAAEASVVPWWCSDIFLSCGLKAGKWSRGGVTDGRGRGRSRDVRLFLKNERARGGSCSSAASSHSQPCSSCLLLVSNTEKQAFKAQSKRQSHHATGLNLPSTRRPTWVIVAKHRYPVSAQQTRPPRYVQETRNHSVRIARLRPPSCPQPPRRHRPS